MGGSPSEPAILASPRSSANKPWAYLSIWGQKAWIPAAKWSALHSAFCLSWQTVRPARASRRIAHSFATASDRSHCPGSARATALNGLTHLAIMEAGRGPADGGSSHPGRSRQGICRPDAAAAPLGRGSPSVWGLGGEFGVPGGGGDRHQNPFSANCPRDGPWTGKVSQRGWARGLVGIVLLAGNGHIDLS